MSQLFGNTSGGGGGGGGDVNGPGASTDNAVVRWDGATGTLIQNSGTILSDGDLMTFPVNTTAGIAFGSSATEITSNNTANTIQFSTNSTVAATINSSQNLVLANALAVSSGGTGANTLTDHGIVIAHGTSPLTATALTDGQLLIGSTGNNPVASTLTAGTGISITNAAGSITIAASGELTGSVTTSDATPTAALTQAAGATPGVYRIEARVAAFNTTDTLGSGYSVFGTVRTTGAATVLVGVPFRDDDEEVGMTTSNADIVVSGNNWIVQVTGVAGKTIKWKADAYYTFVS